MIVLGKLGEFLKLISTKFSHQFYRNIYEGTFKINYNSKPQASIVFLSFCLNEFFRKTVHADVTVSSHTDYRDTRPQVGVNSF